MVHQKFYLLLALETNIARCYNEVNNEVGIELESLSSGKPDSLSEQQGKPP